MTLLHLAPSTSILHVDPVVAFMALFWLVVVTVAIWRRREGATDSKGRNAPRTSAPRHQDRRTR